MQRVKTLFLILGIVILAGCMSPGTKYDPVDPYAFGLRWYERGSYDRALAYWKPLAEAGDCDAQAQLGRLYFEGKGVSRDYPQAIAWWRKAANQGQQKAQIALGDLYYQGEHVAIRCQADCGIQRNLVTAFMWYRLGEKAAYYKAEREYMKLIIPYIRADMSPQELEETEKSITAWQPSPAPCKPRQWL
jgi:hypothetical protein